MVDLLTEEGHDLHPFQETKTVCQGLRDLRPDVIIDVHTGAMTCILSWHSATKSRVRTTVSACRGFLRLKPHGKDQRL
jgi:ADP-heptose:LPS heptosyltransferase